MANDFIFKGFAKAVFSDDSGLNIIPSDLGDDMIAVTFDSDAVTRIRTATGTIASPQLFVEVNGTFHILKTSPQYNLYVNRVSQNSVIPGEVTMYDDSNLSWTFVKMSLGITGWTGSGKDAAAQFSLKANWPVNTKLIASLS